MDYETSEDSYALLFDAEKFIYSVELILSIAFTIAFIYLERFKNFEKFNIDGR